MSTITVEATLGLALACARSFGAAVTRAACDAIAEKVELEELARGPLALPDSSGMGNAASDALAAVRLADGLERARLSFECVAGSDPLGLSAAGRVQFLKAAVAHTAWAESRVNAALLAIAGVTRRIHAVQVGIGDIRAERIEIEDAARSEIALAARWSEAQAQNRLESARLLCALLPTTNASLASGAISHAHATAIAEGAARLAVGARIDVTHPRTDRDGEAWQELVAVTAQLDGRASVIAARSTRSHSRAAVTRIVDSLDPSGMRVRREAAKATHDVWVQAEGDGNALLIARMSTVRANACLNRIHDHANAMRKHAAAVGNPDPRRIGQLRADALAQFVLSLPFAPGAACDDRTLADAGKRAISPTIPVAQLAAAVHDTPGSSRLRADIQVVITLDALLGLQAIDGSGDSSILRGHGGDDELVPASEIRDLLSDDHADVTLRRLVTDPLSGHLLDASPHRYKPSDRLRDFIETRDVRCRWFGCNARATSTRTDLNHAQPFAAGGLTTRANLGVLCRRHHLVKTHEGYEISNSDSDGSCTITTPAGLTYQHVPVPVLPCLEEPPF